MEVEVADFAPVTIRLETKEELEKFYRIVDTFEDMVSDTNDIEDFLGGRDAVEGDVDDYVAGLGDFAEELRIRLNDYR